MSSEVSQTNIDTIVKMVIENDQLTGSQLEKFHQQIQGVAIDSREVQPGFVFVARSAPLESHDFIESAIQKGAIAVIGEKENPLTHAPVPYFKVSDSSEVAAKFAAAYFRYPSQEMRLVGITGTSGKTTVSFLVESILKAEGNKVGRIGTVDFSYDGKVLPATHTTPECVALQKLLRQMCDAGCESVVMEVSSHGLKQKRVDGLAFDAVVFTNLSSEHLDYHPDMEDYYQSKKRLFTEVAAFSRKSGKSPFAVICENTEYGKRLGREIEKDFLLPLRRFQPNDQLKQEFDGIRGEIQGTQIQSKLVGSFNALNLQAAIEVGLGLGVKPFAIQEGLAQLKGVPGRLERIASQASEPQVWVDYAHKPDALEKVLQVLQELRSQVSKNARVMTVFGCGGDRDGSKRPVMGKIAAENSDHVIVTSDNPRTENPDQIVEQIVAGMSGYENFEVCVDRKEAIGRAIAQAQGGDFILIAGKGHETYQILGKTKIDFDDRKLAREFLEKWRAREKEVLPS